MDTTRSAAKTGTMIHELLESYYSALLDPQHPNHKSIVLLDEMSVFHWASNSVDDLARAHASLTLDFSEYFAVDTLAAQGAQNPLVFGLSEDRWLEARVLTVPELAL